MTAEPIGTGTIKSVPEILWHKHDGISHFKTYRSFETLTVSFDENFDNITSKITSDFDPSGVHQPLPLFETLKTLAALHTDLRNWALSKPNPIFLRSKKSNGLQHTVQLIAQAKSAESGQLLAVYFDNTTGGFRTLNWNEFCRYYSQLVRDENPSCVS